VQPAGASGQQPYALRFLSDGRRPWYSYFGSNKIATVDPDTMEVKEFVLPESKTRIRRMGVTSDDMIWYGDWSNGKLVRFNPKDGTFFYNPRPQQIADSTRVNHAEDGSVHYTPRYGAAKDQSGFGVLYPDKDKITTLAPRMLNGAPLADGMSGVGRTAAPAGRCMPGGGMPPYDYASGYRGHAMSNRYSGSRPCLRPRDRCTPPSGKTRFWTPFCASWCASWKWPAQPFPEPASLTGTPSRRSQ